MSTTDNRLPTEGTQVDLATALTTIGTNLGNLNRTASDIVYDNNYTIKGKVDALSDHVDEIDLTEGGTMKDHLYINKTNTSTATNDSRLWLGNNIPNGTEGSSRGVVSIYGANQYMGTLYVNDVQLSADRYYSLPNKSGTIALTSDSLPKMNSQADVSSFSFPATYQSLYIVTIGAGSGNGSLVYNPSVWIVWLPINGGTNVSWAQIVSGTGNITAGSYNSSTGQCTLTLNGSVRCMAFKLCGN